MYHVMHWYDLTNYIISASKDFLPTCIIIWLWFPPDARWLRLQGQSSPGVWGQQCGPLTWHDVQQWATPPSPTPVLRGDHPPGGPPPPPPPGDFMGSECMPGPHGPPPSGHPDQHSLPGGNGYEHHHLQVGIQNYYNGHLYFSFHVMKSKANC